jgi:hypothetical protein
MKAAAWASLGFVTLQLVLAKETGTHLLSIERFGFALREYVHLVGHYQI